MAARSMKPSKMRGGMRSGGKPSMGGPRLQTGMGPGGKPSMGGPRLQSGMTNNPTARLNSGPMAARPSTLSALKAAQSGMGRPPMPSSPRPAMTPTPTATQAGAMAPRAPIAGPRQVNAATSGSMFAKGGEVKKTGGTARGFGMAKPSKFKIY
jgi:hypothetical protein